MNHFARCCRSKPIRPPFADNRPPPRPPSRLKPPSTNSFPRQPPPREIHHVTDAEQYPTADDEYLFRVTIFPVNYQTTPKAKVVIANVPLQVLIDSGASINVIDEKAYQAITLWRCFTFTCSGDVFCSCCIENTRNPRYHLCPQR